MTLRRITPFALLFCCLLLAGCASSSNWGWYVVNPMTPAGWTNLKFLMNGMGATILISLIAASISIVLGLWVALPGLAERSFLIR